MLYLFQINFSYSCYPSHGIYMYFIHTHPQVKEQSLDKLCLVADRQTELWNSERWTHIGLLYSYQVTQIVKKAYHGL